MKMFYADLQIGTTDLYKICVLDISVAGISPYLVQK